ncbi:MAG: glycosyltransferase [Idiomarina sp.]
MMNNKPRVSLFLFAYQQQEFVAEAVSAALAQDYDNLQIVISDDSSNDATVAKIKTLTDTYKGPHDVVVNVNPNNLGIGRHFQHIIDNLVDGELIVAAAGDDISAPQRVTRIVHEWLQHDRPDLVAHDLIEMNEAGHQVESDRAMQYRLQADPTQLSLSERQQLYLQHPYPLPFIGAALAYSRSLYDRFDSPEFTPDYEDHLMYFRALMGGSMVYIREPLVYYRRHKSNFTNRNQAQPTQIETITLGSQQVQITRSELGQYRLHRLVCQQYCDAVSALRKGLLAFDVDFFMRLYEKIHARHTQFLANQVHTSKSPVAESVQPLPAVPYLPRIKIAIFGASAAGQKALSHLPQQFEVIAFVDNNTVLHGQHVENIPIIAPAQLSELPNPPDTILIASTYYFPILAQLTEQLGLPVQKTSRAPEFMVTHFREKLGT